MRTLCFHAIIAWILVLPMDLLLGDPHWLWHPVRGMGKLVQILEGRLYPREEERASESSGKAQAEQRDWLIRQERSARLRGGILVLLVVLVTGALTGGLLALAFHLHWFFGVALWSIMGWQAIASRSLATESMKVYDALKKHDILAARRAVSMIVGRDTDSLDEAGICRATVETVAENSSDGVIAPLCCLWLGGPVLAFVYKAINTMDSMIGYRNDRYRDFGTAAARLDDLVNFPFSRLSALSMTAAVFIWRGRGDGSRALGIFRRDRFCHKSPNSAQTESVMAGALGLQLGGDASYFGKPVHKSTIGDPLREIEVEDIPRACHLMYLTTGIVWGLGLMVLLLLVVLL